MHNIDTQTRAQAQGQAVLEFGAETEIEDKDEMKTVNMDDFFSDAPLDVESAVTGKTCNIFDPECEACQ